MSYQPSPQFDIKSSVIVDAYDIAHHIQALLEQVLIPPQAGLYLANQLEPVLKQGFSYWYEKPVLLQQDDFKSSVNMSILGSALYGSQQLLSSQNQPWGYYRYDYVPVMDFDQVCVSPWDIVDCNPEHSRQPKRVVLPHHLAAGVRNAPTLPVAGINLIQQIIRTEIETSRAYNQRCEVLLEKIVLPFLQPIYQSLEHIRSDRWFQDTLSLVFDAVMPAISPIREMLRYNPYQMCVVQHHEGFQLRVDQLGDYRIMEWERITNDIDYRRWMHLKSNGDWDRYVREQEKSNGDWDRYGVSNNNY